MHQVFGRDVLRHNGISIPSGHSLSGCSTAGLMGLAAQLVAFRLVRGPPERLLP